MIAFALAAASLVLLVPGWLLLRRLRALPSPARQSSRVSVIIPARDEAHNLPRLLRSLAGEGALEVIVADDGSVDDTAAVAGSHGARVVSVPDAPQGWRGKTWGCWTAAQQARGEALVFLDADTELVTGGLARLVGALEARGGLVSAEPYHVVPRPHEQLSLVFNVVRAAGVGPSGAFGPCIATSRQDYFATRGHAHADVRGQVLESFAMGRVYAAAGLPVHGHLGTGTIRVRMYPGGPGELVEGWSKALASGAAGTPRGALLLAVAWISGGMLASGALLAAALFGGHALAAGAAYLGHAAQALWLARRLGSFSPLAALLLPVVLVTFVAVFLRSLYLVRWRGQVSWKGRRISLAERSS